MAPFPSRRRKAAKTLRNLAIAEAALALARDRITRGSRRPTGKLLLLGSGATAAAAAAAVAVLKRDKVAALLPSRCGEPTRATPVPPQPSNYDERAEESAAAAEAAAIGGASADLAGAEPSEPADEEHRPLVEADETADETAGGGISGRPFAGLDEPPAEPGQAEPEPKPDDDSDAGDGPTWSGRSVDS